LDVEKAVNSLQRNFWNVIEYKLKIRMIFI
jgi:hypothetical protein